MTLVTPFRVGLLVLLSAGLAILLLTFFRKGGLAADESLDVYAIFEDASGLGTRSRVQVAGIPVGEIREIELLRGRAKLWLRIDRDVDLRLDAAIRKRSESLLGDYMLDLHPGSAKAPPMPDGGEIRRVREAQGMDAAFEYMEGIAADVREVTSALRDVIGGEKGARKMEAILDNIERMSAGLDRAVRANEARLGETLENLQVFSRELRGIGVGRRDELERIVENVDAMAADARAVMSGLRRELEAATTGEEGESSLRTSLSRLDRTLENLEEMTTTVREGRGTLGALVSDERLGRQVGEAAEDLAELAGRLGRLKTEVGARSELMVEQGQAKNALSIRVIPRPDKHYLLEVVDDPRGEVQRELVQLNPPSAGEPATQIRRVTRQSVKFTAQVAKRYYFTTLRAGITESTGGLGADLHFLDDQLTFKLDAFNFSVSTLRYPRLRATMRLSAFDHLFASVGLDDMLNPVVRDPFSNDLLSGRELFFGAGVFFTDEDLKALLGVAPSIPIP